MSVEYDQATDTYVKPWKPSYAYMTAWLDAQEQES